MNTAINTLDSLTATLQQKLAPTTVYVTASGRHRTYSLGGAKRTRTMPYGRFLVHVSSDVDGKEATALFTDYGVNNKASTSARELVSLLDLDALTDTISQYLRTGVRGE